MDSSKYTFFKKIIEYVENHTSFNIFDPQFDSVRFAGRIGESILNEVSIQVGEMGEYQCYLDISYNGYGEEWATVFQTDKIVKTEEEVITLIDKSISISNKLINTISQLGKELEE